MPTDYGLVVEYLLGVAEYGSCGTYQQLVDTWQDPRPIPSEQEITDAWIIVYKAVIKESILEIRNTRKFPETIDYSSYTFNSSEASCELIANEINRCTRKSLTNLENTWWDNDNVDRLTTLAELEGLEDAIVTRLINTMNVAKTAQVDVDNASTIQAIDTIYAAYVAG
jgi:hypothetical protein